MPRDRGRLVIREPFRPGARSGFAAVDGIAGTAEDPLEDAARWTSYAGTSPLTVPVEVCDEVRAAAEAIAGPHCDAHHPDLIYVDPATAADQRRLLAASAPLRRYLQALFGAANAAWWRLDLDHVMVTALRYRAGHRMGAHVDHAPRSPHMKLSASVQLSPPDAYAGGRLELARFTASDRAADGVWVAAPTDQGAVIVFPAWTPHRVTEVVRGERWSLQMFALGPPIR